MTSIVLKPWGSYEVLNNAPNYSIKRLIINPSAILSLQSHEHRSEHWVVVQGTAEVTLDDKVFTLESNKNIFIPRQSKHRIQNKGHKILVIIEIWYGDQLNEGDITRYEDIYNRI